MKHIKKKIFVMALVVILVMMNTFVASAAETKTEAVYDLEKGGTQTFIIEDEDGEVQKITIEEVTSNARVANGTYKVSCETSNWEAGFYLKISDNKITSAYSPFYTELHGSIKDATLVRNSSVKISYLFIFQAKKIITTR